MTGKNSIRSLAIGCGVVAMVVLAGALSGSAAGAAASGWTLVQVLPQTQNVQPQWLAAAGSGAAWLAGHGTALYAADWNGTRWQPMAVPSDMSDPGLSYNDTAMAAASPTDMWTAVQVQNSSKTTGYTLHWDGIRWTQYQAPLLNRLAVVNPSDVWGFGSAGTAYRFNGSKWLPAATPALFYPNPTALSPGNIWAIGATNASIDSASPVWHIVHWDGTRWTTSSVIPDYAINGKHLIVADGIVTGAGNAWAAEAIPFNRCGCQPPAGGLVLAHWNGHAWRAVLSSTKYYPQGQPVLDGHGGLWEEALIGGTWDDEVLLHYSDGKLQQIEAPAKTWLAGELTGIPGSSSIWTMGSTAPLNATGSVAMLRYTP